MVILQNPKKVKDSLEAFKRSTEKEPASLASSSLLQPEDSKRVADALVLSISNMEAEFAGMCGHIQSIIWSRGKQ